MKTNKCSHKKNWQSPEKVSTKVQNKGSGEADIGGAQNSAKTLPSLSQNKSLDMKGQGQQTLKP